MRPGRLRHRLILQSKSYTRNAYGESEVSFSTQSTVWGAIEPLSGREYYSQQQVQSESKVRIVIRYNASIDTTWRVKHDGLYYDIEDVINHDTRDRMLTLMCREGVSEDEADSATSNLLLENGSALLLETGSNILLDA